MATVDENGLVTAISTGTAIITAEADWGIYDSEDTIAKCEVTVTKDGESPDRLNLSIEFSDSIVYVNDTDNYPHIEEIALKMEGDEYNYTESSETRIELSEHIEKLKDFEIDLSFVSDNTEILTIDKNTGKMSGGDEAGEANVMVTASKSGYKNVNFNINVLVIVPVESITLDKDELALKIGDDYSLTATISPDNATRKSVKWSSDNENVAIVDEDGLVTAISAGTANITAKARFGSYDSENTIAKCEVTVTEGEDITVANVEDITELNSALEDENIKTINITSDISNIVAPIEVRREVTINGAGNSVSFGNLEDIEISEDDGLIIYEKATINNLTVDAGLENSSAWVGTYAIHVYGTEATLNNVTATGGNGGILINGSQVTLTGTVDVSGNGFGGIEVSKGVLTTQNSILTVDGTLVNATEEYKKPTVWLIEGQGEVNGIKEFSTNDSVKENQVQYYIYAENAVKSAKATNLGELNEALEDESIQIINITSDISNINAPVEIRREVAINGGGNSLNFVGLEYISDTTEDDGLIIYEKATVSNLTVNAGVTTPSAWVGTYAIHVYGTEATLSNVTATGGNGGILINGSQVTLTGTVDVSGNGFGGIEVSKGVLTTENSILTVDGTLINATEEYKRPTVWLIEGQGTVGGIEGFTTNEDVEDDQIQYYKVAENAEE